MALRRLPRAVLVLVVARFLQHAEIASLRVTCVTFAHEIDWGLAVTALDLGDLANLTPAALERILRTQHMVERLRLKIHKRSHGTLANWSQLYRVAHVKQLHLDTSAIQPYMKYANAKLSLVLQQDTFLANLEHVCMPNVQSGRSPLFTLPSTLSSCTSH
jgi:hypothetical protein